MHTYNRTQQSSITKLAFFTLRFHHFLPSSHLFSQGFQKIFGCQNCCVSVCVCIFDRKKQVQCTQEEPENLKYWPASCRPRQPAGLQQPGPVAGISGGKEDSLKTDGQ